MKLWIGFWRQITSQNSQDEYVLLLVKAPVYLASLRTLYPLKVSNAPSLTRHLKKDGWCPDLPFREQGKKITIHYFLFSILKHNFVRCGIIIPLLVAHFVFLHCPFRFLNCPFKCWKFVLFNSVMLSDIKEIGIVDAGREFQL